MKLKHLLLTTLALLGFSLSSHAQIPNYVPSNGLVGWWPFNGNANDESGNGLNGTITGSPSLTQDRYNNLNNAYSFDGIDDYIAVDRNYVSSFSLSLWFNPSNSSQYNPLIDAFDANWEIQLNNTFPDYVSFISANNYQEFISTQSTIADNWYHLVCTYSVNTVTLFVNGTQTNQYLVNPLPNNNGSYNFGASLTGADQFYIGLLDDIGIWNRALTEQEVQLLYNGCTVPTNTIVGNITPEVFVSETYTYNATQGSTYQWTVSNGLITSGQGTNSVNVIWAGTGLGTISVQETTSANCQGDTISVDVVVIPTGLEEVENSAFNVFPNPANEIIHLNFAAKTTSAVTVCVTDLSGRLVMNSNSTAVVAGKNTLSINTAALQTGMYFITLSDGKSQQSFRVSVSK